MDHELSPGVNGIKYFLISWDCEGVEYLEDVTKYHPAEWAKLHMFDAIKNSEAIKKNPLSEKVTMMTLRARFNSQRNYEIYMFTATEGIEFDDVKEWADRDPQTLVDFVRENHVLKIFDDRAKPNKRRIV